MAHPTRRAPRDADESAGAGPMRCRTAGCGYVLDGVQPGRCPECGRPFDPGRASTFVRGETPVARWWHRRRHPDDAGVLPPSLARLHAAITEPLGDVALGRGLLLPAVPAWIGVEAVATRSTWLPGHRGHGRLVVLDGDAMVLGGAWLCLAAALHLWFLWGHSERFWQPAQATAVLCGIGATAGLVLVIFRAFADAFG